MKSLFLTSLLIGVLSCSCRSAKNRLVSEALCYENGNLLSVVEYAEYYNNREIGGHNTAYVFTKLAYFIAEFEPKSSLLTPKSVKLVQARSGNNLHQVKTHFDIGRNAGFPTRESYKWHFIYDQPKDLPKELRERIGSNPLCSVSPNNKTVVYYKSQEKQLVVDFDGSQRVFPSRVERSGFRNVDYKNDLIILYGDHEIGSPANILPRTVTIWNYRNGKIQRYEVDTASTEKKILDAVKSLNEEKGWAQDKRQAETM